MEMNGPKAEESPWWMSAKMKFGTLSGGCEPNRRCRMLLTWTAKLLMKSTSLQVLMLSMRAAKSLVEVMFLRIEWMLVEWGTDEHTTPR